MQAAAGRSSPVLINTEPNLMPDDRKVPMNYQQRTYAADSMSTANLQALKKSLSSANLQLLSARLAVESKPVTSAASQSSATDNQATAKPAK